MMRTFPVGHTTCVSGEEASFAITDAGADFALASTKVHSHYQRSGSRPVRLPRTPLAADDREY